MNEDRINFSKFLKELRIYTFFITDIVVTTLLNVADFKLYSIFQPILIFYNEAGKAIKVNSQSLLIKYLYARGVVLIGNSYQLRPITLIGDQENCFNSIISQTLFTYLKMGGLNTILFKTQHRFNIKINVLISLVFYYNRLKAH